MRRLAVLACNVVIFVVALPLLVLGVVRLGPP